MYIIYIFIKVKIIFLPTKLRKQNIISNISSTESYAPTMYSKTKPIWNFRDNRFSPCFNYKMLKKYIMENFDRCTLKLLVKRQILTYIIWTSTTIVGWEQKKSTKGMISDLNCELSVSMFLIPKAPAYGVHIYHLIRYAWVKVFNHDFLDRRSLLMKKIFDQGF